MPRPRTRTRWPVVESPTLQRPRSNALALFLQQQSIQESSFSFTFDSELLQHFNCWHTARCSAVRTSNVYQSIPRRKRSRASAKTACSPSASARGHLREWSRFCCCCFIAAPCCTSPVAMQALGIYPGKFSHLLPPPQSGRRTTTPDRRASARWSASRSLQKCLLTSPRFRTNFHSSINHHQTGKAVHVSNGWSHDHWQVQHTYEGYRYRQATRE